MNISQALPIYTKYLFAVVATIILSTTLAILVHSPFKTQTGLSVFAKQSELFQAPAHVPSYPLLYLSNQIVPKRTEILLLNGVIGIITGGHIMIATRTKSRMFT